jgi:hypothetical protein
MAELGQTDDPRALIPGAPDAIAANAVALRQRAADAGDAGDGLRSPRWASTPRLPAC